MAAPMTGRAWPRGSVLVSTPGTSNLCQICAYSLGGAVASPSA